MGQSENTWPHMKDKSPSKYQKAEKIIFYKKMSKWVALEQHEGKEVSFSDLTTTLSQSQSSLPLLFLEGLHQRMVVAKQVHATFG